MFKQAPPPPLMLAVPFGIGFLALLAQTFAILVLHNQAVFVVFEYIFWANAIALFAISTIIILLRNIKPKT